MGAKLWWRVVFGLMTPVLVSLPLFDIRGIGWISTLGIYVLWWKSLGAKPEAKIEVIEIPMPVAVVKDPEGWVGLLVVRHRQLVEEAGMTPEEANCLLYSELRTQND